MATTAWCPVDRVVGLYGVSNDEMLRLVRMNWRMVVLEIIAQGSPIPYSMIAKRSGLNSRTLTIVLKELAAERLIDRHVSVGKGTSYSVSIIGSRIVTMPCPLLRFASERKA